MMKKTKVEQIKINYDLLEEVFGVAVQNPIKAEFSPCQGQQQIIKLLSEFNATDQQTINDFCSVLLWFENIENNAIEREQLSKNNVSDSIKLRNDINSYSDFIQNHKIVRIQLEGKPHGSQFPKVIKFDSKYTIDFFLSVIRDHINLFDSNVLENDPAFPGNMGQREMDMYLAKKVLIYKDPKVTAFCHLKKIHGRPQTEYSMLIKETVKKFFRYLASHETLSKQKSTNQAYIIGMMLAFAKLLESNETFLLIRRQSNDYRDYRDFLIKRVISLKRGKRLSEDWGRIIF